MDDVKHYATGAISLTVFNEEGFANIFKLAPAYMTNEMAHFMAREGKNFIGTKKHQGSFRRSLRSKKKLDGSGKNWGPGIPYAFTRNLAGYNRIDDMTLRMGLNDKKLPKMPFIPMLGTGGSVAPKDKQWMMVPFLKNLRAVGLFGRMGTSSVAKNNWTKWRAANQAKMQAFFFHGKYLIFGDMPDSSGSHKTRHEHMLNRKLLFVGIKRANIRKRFDFEKSFTSRAVGMAARGQKFVDRAVNRMSQGKINIMNTGFGFK